MITILISQNEEKVKDLLLKALQGAGYDVRPNAVGEQMINIGSNDIVGSLRSLIENLEDSLYRQKKGLLYRAVLDIIEKPMIEHILDIAEGNQVRAARILGINRNTMRSKIKKLAIDVEKWKA